MHLHSPQSARIGQPIGGENCRASSARFEPYLIFGPTNIVSRSTRRLTKPSRCCTTPTNLKVAPVKMSVKWTLPSQTPHCQHDALPGEFVVKVLDIEGYQSLLPLICFIRATVKSHFQLLGLIFALASSSILTAHSDETSNKASLITGW